MNTVPQSYEEWKQYMTQSCDVELTPRYVQQRIAALNTASDHHTQRFIARWGQAHHQKTLGWFQKFAAELGV